jgi:hypothetical protein
MTRALSTQQLETLRDLGQALIAAAPPIAQATRPPTKTTARTTA